MNPPEFSIASVRAFVTVVEAGGVSAAARALGLAQPTVSQQLQRLELAVGHKLIERNHGVAQPTERGAALLRHARALLSNAERIVDEGRGRPVAVGASGNVAAYCIAADLKAADEVTNGTVQWTLQSAPNPELVERLAAGVIDLAATEWKVVAPGLVSRPWRREVLLVIVAPDHQLAAAGNISLDELLKLPLVGGEAGSGTGRVLTQVLGDRARELRVTHTLGSTEAVKSAVRAGLGASIVLSAAVEAELQGGFLKALSIEGARMEKTLHITLPDTVPETAASAKLARILLSRPFTA